MKNNTSSLPESNLTSIMAVQTLTFADKTLACEYRRISGYRLFPPKNGRQK